VCAATQTAKNHILTDSTSAASQALLDIRLQRAPRNPRPFAALSFEQCIFAIDVRFCLGSVKRIWFYLRGIILWGIWLARNDVVFNRTFWNKPRIKQKGQGYYSRVRSIPAAYKNTHSQHLEHPKLAALIIFMSEWELMCRDCYWWRDKNCD
jgi:hypothetical protein